MKKILTLLFVSTFMFTSCSDDGAMGPQGPPGPPGEPGIDIVGQTFEFEVDFEYNSETGYHSAVIGIPNDIEVLPTDAILVYRLEVQEDDQGEFDTWSLLPQNFFLEEGIIQYVFNHSDFDVEIIIDGNFNLANLESGFTDGQIFRFVVIPSDDPQASNVNVEDLKAVMEAYNIQESDVKRIESSRK